MKKKLYLLLAAAMLFGTACSQAENKNITSSETGTPVSESEAIPDVSKMEDIVPTEQPEPKEESFDSKTPFGDTKYYVECLGLKEYDQLESDAYTDKPADGNVFLVLFLNFENRTENEDYINPDSLKASVDGKEMEHTVLFNDPEGYTTLFTHVEPEDSMDGFVVWEVPKDWQKLDVDFDNWKYTDQVVLQASFTRDDLKAPVPAEDRKEPE